MIPELPPIFSIVGPPLPNPRPLLRPPPPRLSPPISPLPPPQAAPRLTLAQTIVAVEEGDLTAWLVLLRHDTSMIDDISGYQDNLLEHFLLHCSKFYPKHEDFLNALEDIVRANKATSCPLPPLPPLPSPPLFSGTWGVRFACVVLLARHRAPPFS